MSNLITPTNILLEFLAGTIGQKNKRGGEGLQIRKEEINLSLFADDIISYPENPKE